MLESAHPQLEVVDYAVRILGWPTLLGIIVWVIRKYDAGQAEFKKLSVTTTAAAQGVEQVQQQVTLMQTNHLAHLQQGIDSVAKTNTEAVAVLREISSGITLVLDRVPRA